MQKIINITLLSLLFSFPSIITNGQFVVSDPKATLAIIENKVTTLAQLQQNYNLTKSWVDGLQKISTRIRDYARIAETLDLTIKTISEHKKTTQLIAQSQELDWKEKQDLLIALANVLAENKRLVIDLGLATKTGLSMTDKDRIDLIYQTHEKVQNNYSTICYVNQQIDLAIRGRQFQQHLQKML